MRILLIYASAWVGALAGLAESPGRDLVISNESLVITWSSSSAGLSITERARGRTVLRQVHLSESGGTGKVINISDKSFGVGPAIEIIYANGQRDRVMLFPGLPFGLFRTTLINWGSDTSKTTSLNTLSATLDLGKPAAQLKTLGSGGLLAADQNPGSYAWLAVADPPTRNGLVSGWLTHHRGSGVIFSSVEADAVKVQAVLEYGKLRLAPGKTEDTETLAVGYFDDARIGLEHWADAVAKVHQVRLKPQPTGYCTWYSKPHGGAADETHLAELAGFCATKLAPFGFSVVQIDDGWQAGYKRTNPGSPKKDFRTHNPRGPYPSGMKAIADRVKSLGLVPGIWFMPFAGTVGDPFFDEHLDWFARTTGGEPYDTPWGGTCLDLTNPGARAHVRDVTRRICREWGFQYLKIDGLWTGMATKQMYVNSGYKPDDLGEAVFHDPNQTGIEAFRAGLKLVREAAGRNVFILGCNTPQNMRTYGASFGLVDAMRVGPDNGASWKSLLRGPTFGSRHYFLNGRVWYNDPDPVYVRGEMPLNHARLICSWVALSGQLNLSSEWIPGLPADRQEILKRTMPSHHALARPVDLFETDLPRIWTVTAPGRIVIGLFNWESKESRFDLPLLELGLPATNEYSAFDFWSNRLLPVLQERLPMTLPAESCAVLALCPIASHPQLISTSRHVTQGIVDVSEEHWDEPRRMLQGRSKLVGGDPYELRILTGGASVAKVEVRRRDQAAGVKWSCSSSDSLLRVNLISPVSREVSWSVTFR